jgi:hypothetical protein
MATEESHAKLTVAHDPSRIGANGGQYKTTDPLDPIPADTIEHFEHN